MDSIHSLDLMESVAQTSELDLNWDISSDADEFVDKDELTPQSLDKTQDSVFFRAQKLLPPIVDLEKDKRDSLLFFLFVVVSMLCAFYVGSKNSRAILNGVDVVSEKISDFNFELLKTSPKVSYVFLRELPLTRGAVLIKSDSAFKTRIKVRLYDENQKVIRTKNGQRSLTLLTNENGEAYLKLSDFDAQIGETYVITTQIGHLKATKNYFYSNN